MCQVSGHPAMAPAGVWGAARRQHGPEADARSLAGHTEGPPAIADKTPPEAEALCREHCSATRQKTRPEVQAVAPSSAERPVSIFCQDGRRVGRLPVPRRRLTLRGVTPGGPVQDGCEHGSVYGAIEPTTGERVFLE